MKEKSTETSTESRPVWESLEALAQQGVQRLLQQLLEEEVEEVLGRRRYERRDTHRSLVVAESRRALLRRRSRANGSDAAPSTAFRLSSPRLAPMCANTTSTLARSSGRRRRRPSCARSSIVNKC
jgi:hypothetical protein